VRAGWPLLCLTMEVFGVLLAIPGGRCLHVTVCSVLRGLRSEIVSRGSRKKMYLNEILVSH
jgi:hypothetical protein